MITFKDLYQCLFLGLEGSSGWVGGWGGGVVVCAWAHAEIFVGRRQAPKKGPHHAWSKK